VCVATNLHAPLSPLFRGESQKFKISQHQIIQVSQYFAMSKEKLNGVTFICQVSKYFLIFSTF